jgi:hypothetical protein
MDEAPPSITQVEAIWIIDSSSIDDRRPTFSFARTYQFTNIFDPTIDHCFLPLEIDLQYIIKPVNSIVDDFSRRNEMCFQFNQSNHRPSTISWLTQNDMRVRTWKYD